MLWVGWRGSRKDTWAWEPTAYTDQSWPYARHTFSLQWGSFVDSSYGQQIYWLVRQPCWAIWPALRTNMHTNRLDPKHLFFFVVCEDIQQNAVGFNTDLWGLQTSLHNLQSLQVQSQNKANIDKQSGPWDTQTDLAQVLLCLPKVKIAIQGHCTKLLRKSEKS